MRTVKTRVIIRHITALSLLIFLGLTASGYRQRTKAASATKTEDMPTLRGEAALTHLKEQGVYSSLGEAIKAARHNAQALPPGVDPILTVSRRLEAGDGAAEDFFGAAVAIIGDNIRYEKPPAAQTIRCFSDNIPRPRGGALWPLKT